MVCRQGALRESFAAEECQADIVIGTILNELVCYRLGSLNAVGLQVVGEHTRGNIERKHDVDALNLLFTHLILHLWSGKDNDHGNKSQDAQYKGQMNERQTQCMRHATEGLRRSHAQ